MAALPLQVELQLDRRSATSVANDVQQAWSEAGRNISRDFNRSMSGIGTDSRKLGRDAGNAFRTEMTSGINEAVRGVTSQFGAMGRAAESTFTGMSGKAKLGALGIAGIGTAAVVVGKQLYDLGAQWDSIADSITIRTGAVGSELTALTDAVGDVGRTTAASLGSIGNIMGQLSQSMPDLAQNNAAIRDMASNLAYLDANGQAVNIRELGQAFNVFRVNAADQVKTLDDLNRASQATGIPINELIGTIQQGAPQFMQFGLTLSQSTGLLASFERGGLDAGVAVTGLRIALKNLGGDEAALADTITKIKELSDAGQAGSAQDLAENVFGTKNFAPFLQAIQSGTLNVQGLKKALDETGLSLQQLQAQTDDGAQGFQKLSNTVQTVLGPAADFVFGAINTNVQVLTGNLTDLTSATAKLADDLKEAAAVPITPDSALGRMLLPAGGLPGMAGTPAATGIGGAYGQGLKPYSWGSDLISPSGGGAGKSGLPGAPAVPYDTSLPPGFAGLPQTPGMFSAESSFMDARQSLAEKQARLNQLEQSNEATAEDIQNARNDVVTAERGMQEAELRLYDARQDIFDKNLKQLRGQADQLGEIGAQLDDDFGVSKGLAGIADNITKFLLNLALVPVMAQLKGIQAASGYDPANAGKGLMGVLGAQGAFGPQYTQAAQQAAMASSGGAAAMGPGVGQPYGAGPAQSFAAQPGQSARDFAHESMMPFWQSQGFSVGDHAADKYGEHQNGALDIMVDSIAEGNDVLRQVLQDPNVYGAIFNNQAFGYGQGAEPRPYSGGFTGNPTQDHQDHVHAYYKPGGANNIAPSGGGGGGMPSGAPQWSADWNAIAQGESGGNWSIDTGNGYQGGLQFAPSSWAAAGGTQYAPSANLASPYQQAMTAEQLLAMQGPGAWPNTFVPGSTGPAAPGWGGPGIPGGLTGGGGQGPIFGGVPQGPGLGGAFGSPIGGGAPGLGGALGMRGASPSQSVAGGRQFGQGIPASGGLGFGGGIIGAAGGAGMGALNMMAPGAGAGAQIGMDLAMRAAGAGGQYAANAVSGLMETFMLNDSALGDPGKSWFGRLAIGVAGMRPALPNSAGALGGEQNPNMAEGGKKPAGPLTPEQAAIQGAATKGGEAAVKQGDTTNINVTNNRATEDGTGRDIQAHMGAAQASKQWTR